jgi:hypothetical protein
MSTIQRVNFELVTSVVSLLPKDFALADKTLADPLNSANPFIDGEWFIIDANYKAAVACDRSGAGNVATQTAYPIWAEKGRWDTQAMSEKKVPLLFLGDYEADTRVFDASAVVSGGAAITTVGQPLKVASITLGAFVKIGLVGAVAGDGEPIVGRVTRLPAQNGGKLRFVRAHTI